MPKVRVKKTTARKVSINQRLPPKKTEHEKQKPVGSVTNNIPTSNKKSFDDLLSGLLKKGSADCDDSDQDSETIPSKHVGEVQQETEIGDHADLVPLLTKIKNNVELNADDAYIVHMKYELSHAEVENLIASNTCTEKVVLKWPKAGFLLIDIPTSETLAPNLTHLNKKEATKLEKQQQVLKHADLLKYSCKTPTANTSFPLSALQDELFTILNGYHDLFYPQRKVSPTDDISLVYCLHALNHIMRTLPHIKNVKEVGKSENSLDSQCDRGFVGPKVLILLPYRESAVRVVSMLSKLLHGDKRGQSNTNGSIMNFDRFVGEYSGPNGNIDDNFRIGLSIKKKHIKLYVSFLEAEIVIASPLGLRLLAKPSDKSAYDFLSSIELLVIDQAEILFAQNWENVLNVFDVLNMRPQSLQNSDLQSVHSWYLKGWSRFYRQTVIFSSHELPEFRALFNNKLCNHQGKVRISNPIIRGDIHNVIVPIYQYFHRIPVSDLNSVCDTRFNFFINTILPRFKDTSRGHCMVYVPSYLDFIRLRNYFKIQTISFVQICEYSKKTKITRARDMFFHGRAQFILYSERSHFFRRTRIKGIHHLIFYQPPYWPTFYSDMVNLLNPSNQNTQDGVSGATSVTMLYTKYDLLQLGYILGTERTASLLKSPNTTQFFGA